MSKLATPIIVHTSQMEAIVINCLRLAIEAHESDIKTSRFFSAIADLTMNQGIPNWTAAFCKLCDDLLSIYEEHAVAAAGYWKTLDGTYVFVEDTTQPARIGRTYALVLFDDRTSKYFEELMTAKRAKGGLA